MARKKRQTQLTFEPVNPTSSPNQASSNQASPAKVRYSKNGAGASSPSRSSRIRTRLRRSVGESQDTSSPTRPPTASFMPRLHGSKPVSVGDDSSDDSVTEADDDMPPKSSQSVSTRLQRTVINVDDDGDEDEDEGEEPIVPPSTLKRRRPIVIPDDDDDDDDNDEPVAPPSSSRRSRPKFVELEDSSDGDASPAKKRKISLKTPGRLKRPGMIASSSPTKKGARRGHRSAKQKKMELLRRRRAGEKLDKLTSSEEDSEPGKRGIYDTDSEQEFGALKEFDDEDPEEEETEEPSTTHRSSVKGRPITKRSRKELDNQEDSDKDKDDSDGLDDFVIDDDDGLLGAPANLDIPLEFTAHAHRPLKDQFPYVIEWLVHNRINPAFERNDPVYSNAWRKLDDEVHALASSKFASAAWKSEFYRALKGRPKMESYEMDRGERHSGLHDTCDACGRSNHPATFKIYFQGHPYYKNTLADVESDSEDSDSNDSGHESVDTQGMILPPTGKEWNVGAVCCSNAETAHSLIHWKHALKQWVEERLDEDGWMAAKKLKERERMKARKRRDLANRIVDDWREKSIIASLYRDFKNTLEDARNKATTGRNRGRFR